jgi:hypothetical protein
VVRRLRRPEDAPVVFVPGQLPLHERTLNALEAVRAKQLWQQGQVKQYHSEITDILRDYIERRYGVAAMERTTDELLAALKGSAMEGGERDRLGNLLRLADLVKFAKYTAVPAENEQLLEGAMTLVRNTAEPVSHAANA